jgi:WD40 repeat protein
MSRKIPKVDFSDETYLNHWCDFLGVTRSKGNDCFLKKKLQILNLLSNRPAFYRTWSSRKRFKLKNLVDMEPIYEYKKKITLPCENQAVCFSNEIIYKQVVCGSKMQEKLEIETEYSVFAFERPLSTVSLSESTLLVGSFDGGINLYETNTFTKISSHYNVHTSKISDSINFKDNFFLTSGLDGKIYLVSKEGTSIKYSIPGPIQCLNVNASFPTLSVAEKFYNITFIDLFEFKPILTQKCHNGSIYDVDFDSRGFIYVTTGSDKKTNIWDSRSGKLLNSMKSHDEVVSIKFFDENYQLFFGCDSGAVRKIDLRNFSIVNEVYGHSSLVVNLNKGNNLLLSSSYDGCVNIYDPINLKILAKQKIHEGKITDSTIKDSSANNFFEFITCGNDKTFKKGIVR